MKNILIAISASPIIISLLFLAHRVFQVPVNHISLTPHYLDILSICSILLALIFRVSRPALWGIALLAAINTLLVVWVIDTHNFLEYEDWIKRGMPEKTVGPGS
ncbi:hypothetical protein [Cupriavidus sp. PET2-C1]